MSIRILSSQIINQISAGEIINSPASVVKELMENSLDAGSTDIKINIYNGGIKLINLRDNGCGMSKYDLRMAIQNHSTSKIFSINDLSKISTLGFRGEALASISSVSRLTISSSVSNHIQGWELYSETTDPKILRLNPIAHPLGTSINVLDLFYNFPVKRRYLKTEKTEFIKIDEIIKKIALSRQDINICFSHNDKIINQYCAVKTDIDSVIRLKKLCGKYFSENFLPINLKFKHLQLTGWVCIVPSKKSNKNIQYHYVNSRIVYNKIFNHAINQAVYEIFGNNKIIWSVLYLEIPPNYVDVNIHPTKREVQLYEFRLVHSLIYQAILNVLKKFISNSSATYNANDWILQNKDTAGINFFSQKNRNKLMTKVFHTSIKENDLEDKKIVNKNSFVCSIITIIKNRYVLIEYQEELALISLQMAVILLIQFELNKGIKKGLKIQYLLAPYIIEIINQESLNIIFKHRHMLYELGFETTIKDKKCIFHTMPVCLHLKKKKYFINLIVNYLISKKIVSKDKLLRLILKNFRNCISNWNYLKIFSTLSKLEKCYPEIIYSPPSSLLQKIYISSLIRNLK